MIITLTLNPAIDHTVVVDELAPGDTNRARESRTDVGVNLEEFHVKARRVAQGRTQTKRRILKPSQATH